MTTKVFTTGNPLFMETFKEGAEIGLFISDCNQGNVYKGALLHENVKSKATLSSDGSVKWVQSPEVYLESDRSILIFAYYPYQEQSHLNPASIPIIIPPSANETPEYKYGRLSQGQKDVSGISPLAKISMKYALTLLSFELYLGVGMDGEFKLMSIQVGNLAGGNTLRFRGTMDIMTGKIKGKQSPYGATRFTLDKASVLHHSYSEEHSIRIIPTYSPVEDRAIEFHFTINERTYTYVLPKGTYWKKGHKYLYRFLFTGNEIKLIGVTTYIRVPHSHK